MRFGISTKLVLFLIASAIVVVISVGMMRYHVGRVTLDSELDVLLNAITRRLVVSLEESVYESDAATIDDTIKAEFYDEHVEAVIVYGYGREGEPIWFGGRQRVGLGSQRVRTEPQTESLIAHQQNIIHEDEDPSKTRLIGHVIVYVDRAPAERALLAKFGRRILESALIVAVLVLLLAFVTNRYVVKPLDQIRHAMSNVESAQSSEVNGPMNVAHDPISETDPAFDELRSMGTSFDSMLEAIHQRQNDLQRSEAFLKNTGQIAQVAGWQRDVVTRELKWTEGIYDIFEFPPGITLSREMVVNCVHPDDREGLEPLVRRAETHAEPYDVDLRITTARGTHRWIRAVTTPLVEDGKVVIVRGTIQDITDRKNTEEKIFESEHRYRMLFETAGDAIFLMLGDKFIDCNPKTLEMFACSREEMIGSPPYRFSPLTQPDGRDSKEKAIEKISVAFAGEPQFFEWEHCTLDGTPFPAEVSLNCLELHGQMHLLAIVRDISERKKAEEELARASELKSKFIKVAGHELRTPLSYIMAMPKLMSGVTDPEKLQNALHTMEAKGRRLSDIVQSMFKLMPEQGYVNHLDLRDSNLHDILNRVYEDCLPFVEERKQTLLIDQDPSIPPMNVDPNKIHDALENIIGNAIKFTPESGTIRVVAKREGDSLVRVSVTDQGPGIAPEDLPHIFTPFYSIEDVMKHSSGSIGKMKHGMGLGLAVVKHFMEMHGGRVEAKSTPDGSTFTIHIPIQPVDGSAEGSDQEGLFGESI